MNIKAICFYINIASSSASALKSQFWINEGLVRGICKSSLQEHKYVQKIVFVLWGTRNHCEQLETWSLEIAERSLLPLIFLHYRSFTIAMVKNVSPIKKKKKVVVLACFVAFTLMQMSLSCHFPLQGLWTDCFTKHCNKCCPHVRSQNGRITVLRSMFPSQKKGKRATTRRLSVITQTAATAGIQEDPWDCGAGRSAEDASAIRSYWGMSKSYCNTSCSLPTAMKCTLMLMSF